MLIRPSTDLRYKYSELSAYCHSSQSPVYITRKGTGDLVILSIDTYEKLIQKVKDLEQELSQGKDRQP
jgi:prevent-host-death family protein